jgi:hypothetical protein
LHQHLSSLDLVGNAKLRDRSSIQLATTATHREKV